MQVDLGSREQLGPEFQAINPYCTVPVLELDDGTRLNSTAGIWNYLEAECPEPPLLGTTPQEKGVIADLQWRIEIDGFFAMAELLRNSASRIGSAEKHLVSSQIADIISLNINSLAPEGSQSARFCGAPPAKACSFAWRFC